MTLLFAIALIVAGGAAANAGQAQSFARAQLLDGHLLGGDTDGLVEQSAAAFHDGSQPGPVVDSGADVTVLETLSITLGPVPLFGDGGILTLGALNQYAEANVGGSSRASSGTVDDDGLLAGPGPGGEGARLAIGTADLGLGNALDLTVSVGVIAAFAAWDIADPDGPAGSHHLTDLELVVGGQLIAAAADEIDAVLGPAVDDLNEILDALGHDHIEVANPLASGQVTIDEAALAAVSPWGNVNDVPPGTNLLEFLPHAIAAELDRRTDDVMLVLQGAVDEILAAGALIDALCGLIPLLSPTLCELIDGDLAGFLSGLLVDTADDLDGIAQQLVGALTDVLAGLLRLEVGNEGFDGDGAFHKTALTVVLLDGSAAELGLMNAVVGPNQAADDNGGDGDGSPPGDDDNGGDGDGSPPGDGDNDDDDNGGDGDGSPPGEGDNGDDDNGGDGDGTPPGGGDNGDSGDGTSPENGAGTPPGDGDGTPPENGAGTPPGGGAGTPPAAVQPPTRIDAGAGGTAPAVSQRGMLLVLIVIAAVGGVILARRMTSAALVSYALGPARRALGGLALAAAVGAVLVAAAGGGLVGDTPLAAGQDGTDTGISAVIERRSAPHEPDFPPAPSPAGERQRDADAEKDADVRGEPTRIVIPAIDVDVDVVGVGLEADGSMQVPAFGFAGWYTAGPQPGHPGPAVIAAHRDSHAGPDVFSRLGDLTAGDEIHVVYARGDDVTFHVDTHEQTPKDELPIGAIWPTTSDRRLTLITCGGAFDRRSGHYRDNLIVYAAAPAGA